ncbi:MAG: DUF4145 domain-containing protein [Fibrobacter sp.]|nr:DUF4145 domain-containing protein [Fibrobacter sp.]
MTLKEKFKREMCQCIEDAEPLLLYLQGKLAEDFSFRLEYQKWYSKALKIVEFLGSDRFEEFKSYYEINPKRKEASVGNYCIQDYFKGILPSHWSATESCAKSEVFLNVLNQVTILVSIKDRVDWVISDMQTHLLVKIQKTELKSAKKLLEINIRASGVIAGVVLERHLLNVLKNRKIDLKGKSKTISNLNDLLDEHNLVKKATWRRIQSLADTRNDCAHDNKEEPTKEDVKELLSGVSWIIGNVF